MNILKRFLEQVFTPEKVEATPENLQNGNGGRPAGSSAATTAAWKNPLASTAFSASQRDGKGTLGVVRIAASGHGLPSSEQAQQ
ncbi:hypothetical protein ABGM91_05320 [Akkermansia muciniphila]|uniref:hypothetical protein n=1 Tax=Akkermansia muciniphila TaxID=239935 RepID=UPI0033AE839B